MYKPSNATMVGSLAIFFDAIASIIARSGGAPKLRSHPDFPLRNFVRCATCGRGLTGSWSKGRNEYYAYYRCRPGCRGVNVAKAKVEALFSVELAKLQPNPGYSGF